jgi:HlyD family secretion protein
MKKKILLIIAVIALVGIVSFLVIKKLTGKESLATFETVKVQSGKISNNVTATGTIQALKTVNVGTQVSGIIQKIYVDFNDIVKKGQLLAKLDETALRAQLEQSQASVDQAQAQLDFQQATYERLKGLFDKNLIAKADYDQALYNYQNSKAALINSLSALARAKVNLDYCTIMSPIDGVVLNRAIEEGQTVAASFNTPTLFTIVNDLTQMEVQTSVDEADIGKIKLGQNVEFNVDTYPDNIFKGSVAQIRLQPVTTNNVVTYVVILNAPNPDKKLMPGMTATATIFVEEKANTLILSGKAVRFTPPAAYLQKIMAEYQKNKAKSVRAGSSAQGQPVVGQAPATETTGQATQHVSRMSGSGTLPANEKKVWIKNDKGGIRPVIITTGIDNGTNVEVLSGLKEGDEVVISMTEGSARATAAASSTTNRARGPFPF